MKSHGNKLHVNTAKVRANLTTRLYLLFSFPPNALVAFAGTRTRFGNRGQARQNSGDAAVWYVVPSGVLSWERQVLSQQDMFPLDEIDEFARLVLTLSFVGWWHRARIFVNRVPLL